MAQNQEQGETAGGMKHMLDKATDVVGGMVGLASASTAGSHSSEGFVMNACVGDLYELEAAQIALQRSRSESVRAFAQMMIDHHTTAMHQMRSALRSSEVRSRLPDLAPTTELDDRRKAMIKHLREAPEDNLDKTYLDQQKLAHQETVTLHKGYAESGDNPQLRSLAASGVPMVERHLETLRRIGHH